MCVCVCVYAKLLIGRWEGGKGGREGEGGRDRGGREGEVGGREGE